jgi:hypothetical protein
LPCRLFFGVTKPPKNGQRISGKDNLFFLLTT